MTLALAHSRRWLDYDGRIAHVLARVRAHGRKKITVRQLLAHQAGLFAFDEPVDRRTSCGFRSPRMVLARQRPRGSRARARPITRSRWVYEGETDAAHRSQPSQPRTVLSRRDRVASQPGRLRPFARRHPKFQAGTARKPQLLDEAGRHAVLVGPGLHEPAFEFRRALKGSSLALDRERVYARDLEVPSGGGVGTARAIAQAYSIFAIGGRELQLRPESLQALSAPAIPSKHGFYDECMKGEVQFSLGFMKPNARWPFGSPAAFGAPGAGGSLGFADPKEGIGYAYVTNRMGVKITGDPREIALRNALFSALRRLGANTA